MNAQAANIIITPLKSAILEGHKNKLQVLVRMQAPDLPEFANKERQPYGIAFVIDRSGSMSGEPLNEAIRCVDFMVDRLIETDSAALVTFDNEVRLDHPLHALSNKQKFKTILASVDSGGTTNLHGGWSKGADEFSRKESTAAIKRVILLSDGCANEGVVDPVQIAQQAELFASCGITTSTYGLGREFNEGLMVELARAGQGNHYYAEKAEDLLESFNEEFDLMSNLWAKGLVLSAKAKDGVQLRLMNDYRQVDGNSRTWLMPNIAYASEAWAIFEVTLSSTSKVGELIDLFSVSLSGIDINSENIYMESSLLSLPLVSASVFGAIAEDELVQRRLDEVMASEYLQRARQAVHRGDWDAADAILQEARGKFKTSLWAQDVLSSMERLAKQRDDAYFMKEALFSDKRLGMHLSQKMESADLISEHNSISFLRRKTAQGKAQFFDDCGES